PPEKDPELIEQISQMLRMILTGARTLGTHGGGFNSGSQHQRL
ncbi:TetR family transcriptional regulator, partial [Xanthomonas oryzae pv. oryzae]